MFDVRGAESFQSEYQRLVESLLRRFTDLEENAEREAQRQNKGQSTSIEPLGKGNITISDNKGNVLYEKESGKCSISPEQIQKLESASIANPGEVVENLLSLKVEVDGETFFESQDNKVVVNRRANYDYLGDDDYDYPAEQSNPDSYTRESSEIEADKQQNEEALADVLVEMMVPIIEAMPAIKQEPFQETIEEDIFFEEPLAQSQDKPSLDVETAEISRHEETRRRGEGETRGFQYAGGLNPPPIESRQIEESWRGTQTQGNWVPDSRIGTHYAPRPRVPASPRHLVEEATAQPTSVLLPQKTGLDAVQEALGDMKPGTLKSVLQGMAADMQETQAFQPPTPALNHVAFTRLQDRQNPHWWDTLSTKISTTVTAVQETFAQHQAASTLKDFANRMALQPGDSFEGKDYNLSRQGNNYTLKDKEGNELLKFQSSPLGVKVDKSLPALDATHFSKTQQLRQDFKTGQQHKGAFVSQGAAEATNIERINTITQALTQYAAAQGGRAKVQGKFNYSFEASSSGSAIIRNSEGKALLAVGLGEMRSRMSEKDLQHFEQMLPALGGKVQQFKQATQAQTKSLASSGKQLEI